MVTIMEIEKFRSKCWLYLDNGEKYCLTNREMLDSGLTTGSCMEDADFINMIRLYQYPRALNQAIAMLARRPCSKKEIDLKLQMNHYLQDVIELVLYKLEKENLINDLEFCDQWIHYRISQKNGPEKIRLELKQKGIDDITIEQKMTEIYTEDCEDNAFLLAKKAWNHIRADENRFRSRQKVIASLIRKGYNWDQAEKACNLAETECKKTAR